MTAKVNEFSVFDGNIVGLLLFNCNVKLICFLVLTNMNVVANNPKLTIQQYAKTTVATIFIKNNKHTLFSQKNKDKSNCF